jgi:NAD-dependent dihydropyrimidine dehydrogenase PreA subunit
MYIYGYSGGEEVMAQLTEHPTVKQFQERQGAGKHSQGFQTLDSAKLRQLCLDAGAEDVGFVEMGRPEIGDQRDDILQAFPFTRTLISFVLRMNRENIRTPARSVANLEFHHTGEEVDEVARRIVVALTELGVRAANGAAMGFPMEMDRWPGKVWLISHKPVAVAAGLGKMGIHRNVIHPKFGNFVLLSTVVTEAEVSEYSRPLDFNPCLECKLCVSACPTGAIGADGHFNFSACYTHNYREFMGGFSDWVESVADSGSAREYRKKVSDSETVSLWQSLGFGPNYKAAYCLSVCPAGEDVIAPFLTDRKQFLTDVVKPLQNKPETVYVRPASDAEDYVRRRFPHKKVKLVGNGLRPRTIEVFLNGLANTFERGKAKGLDATYHFTFTGTAERKATVRIQQSTLSVEEGHSGKPNLQVMADADTWLRFLAKDENIVWALLRRKIRLKGSPRLLLAFGKCFAA